MYGLLLIAPVTFTMSVVLLHYNGNIVCYYLQTKFGLPCISKPPRGQDPQLFRATQRNTTICCKHRTTTTKTNADDDVNVDNHVNLNSVHNTFKRRSSSLKLAHGQVWANDAKLRHLIAIASVLHVIGAYVLSLLHGIINIYPIQFFFNLRLDVLPMSTPIYTILSSVSLTLLVQTQT